MIGYYFSVCYTFFSHFCVVDFFHFSTINFVTRTRISRSRNYFTFFLYMGFLFYVLNKVEVGIWLWILSRSKAYQKWINDLDSFFFVFGKEISIYGILSQMLFYSLNLMFVTFITCALNFVVHLILSAG